MAGNPSLNVGVIGAGIAGLSAAIALSKDGHKVTIFEKSSFEHEAGAAIVLGTNATRILSLWGFDFKKAGAVPNGQMRRIEADTLRLDSQENWEATTATYGSPWLLLHRADLHQGLRNLLQSVAGFGPGGETSHAKIEMRSEVVSVDCQEGILVLADGSTIQKDLLVVADGAHCRHLRSFEGEDASLIKTPLSIYRFLVPYKEILGDARTRSLFEGQVPGFTTFYKTAVGRPGHILQTYPCRSGELLYCGLVHLTPPAERNLEGWDHPAAVEDVMKAADSFHPTVKSICEKAKNVKVYNQMYRNCIEKFVQGRAVLIGDAAHFMLPAHGQGASVSIEDAQALGILLRGAASDSNGIYNRLDMFQQLRHPRACATQALSNLITISGQRANAEARRYYPGPLPPENSKTFSKEFCDFFFQYDVTKEAEEMMREQE